MLLLPMYVLRVLKSLKKLVFWKPSLERRYSTSPLKRIQHSSWEDWSLLGTSIKYVGFQIHYIEASFYIHFILEVIMFWGCYLY